MGATAKIDVSDSVAALDQFLDSVVRELHAVAQVHIMQILTKSGNGIDSLVCDIAALGEDQVAQARSSIDDLLDGTIGKSRTTSQVENTEMLVRLVHREREERVVVN